MVVTKHLASQLLDFRFEDSELAEELGEDILNKALQNDEDYHAERSRFQIHEIELDATNTVLSSLGIDVDTVKEDINTINIDLSSIKDNINTIDFDINTIDLNLHTIDFDIDSIRNNVNAIDIDIDSIKNNVNTIDVDLSSMKPNIYENSDNILAQIVQNDEDYHAERGISS